VLYARLGSSGLTVSRLCLGAMNFGTPGWGCDRDEAGRIVAAFRDVGGTFFDTADVYGGGASEDILGELLRGDRDEVVIATKVGMTIAPGPNPAGMSAKHIRTAVEGSLRRLRTGYIDLYQVHHYDAAVPLEETLGVLDDLVHAGLVRYAGCSNYFAWQIAEAAGTARALGLTRFVSAQMMYNLVRRDIEEQHLDVAARFGVGLIAYGPLHSGLLAGGWTDRSQIPATSRIAAHPEVYLGDEARSFAVTRALVEAAAELGCTPGQLALAWVHRNQGITSVLTAAQSAGELVEQLAALELDIPPATVGALHDVSALPVGYPSDFYERLRDRVIT
jgi:aryl-alcohol dehydrogenase-like predicted oxidoreductase